LLHIPSREKGAILLWALKGSFFMVIAPITHIRLDEQGVAWISNTTTKVIEIVQEHNAYGFDARRLHAEHPHLSLAQIHAALSYYYDHRDEIDAEIARRYNRVETLRTQATGQLSRQELEARKLQHGESSI
jgi:uncharacterized protein (DUF433 family)